MTPYGSKVLLTNSLHDYKLKSKQKFDFANLAKSATAPDIDDGNYNEANLDQIMDYSMSKLGHLSFPFYSSTILPKFYSTNNSYFAGQSSLDSLLFPASPIR